MARHRITGRALADELGKQANSISYLRKFKTLPRIGGEELEAILNAIKKLAEEDTKTSLIGLTDLLE
ncbi:MAG: transcriptional regulator [Symploca sp. SIO2E9]|nr:transcriptional regulator [Symploca sp. SIO2E9]